MAKITVRDTEIILFKKKQEDYFSLTDIAKVRGKENSSQIISLWLRTYNTIEYLGLWEMLNNPNFKPHIYEGFKNEHKFRPFSYTVHKVLLLLFSFNLFYKAFGNTGQAGNF